MARLGSGPLQPKDHVAEIRITSLETGRAEDGLAELAVTCSVTDIDGTVRPPETARFRFDREWRETRTSYVEEVARALQLGGAFDSSEDRSDADQVAAATSDLPDAQTL